MRTALVFLVVCAACSRHPAPMSKDEFVRAANAICARVNGELDRVAEPKSATELPRALQNVIAVYEKAQHDLRALRPPAEDKAAVESNLLAVNDQQVRVLKDALPALQSAAAKGDQQAVEATFAKADRDATALAAKSKPWATSYGLTECA
jgi:hypothetical protein